MPEAFLRCGWRRRAWRSRIAIKTAAFACALAAGAGGQAAANEIWFAPRAPYDSSRPAPEWDALFDPDASSAWLNAAARTAVFSWNVEHVAFWPAAKLADEASWLHAHGMKIAVTVMAMETFDPCGAHREGYDAPGVSAAVAAKLRKAGVKVDILQMDAPMNFGHYIDGLCKWPIEEVAAHAASALNGYLAAFPDAEIADIEGAPVLGVRPTFEADYAAFKSGVESATGRRITHLQFDVQWGNAAIAGELPRLQAFAHGLGMRFGLFYDGTGAEQTDAEWVRDAENAVALAESRLGGAPDDAIIASWDQHPAHILPDSDAYSLSHLLREQARPRAALELKVTGGAISGRLLDETSKPISGALVTISRLDVDPARTPRVHSLRSLAPANARFAVVGWHVNDECNCSGENDLVLGDLSYAETSGGSARGTLSLPDIAAQTGGKLGAESVPGVTAMGGVKVVRLRIPASGSFQYSSGVFPVTPGAAFTLSAPVGSHDGGGMFGHATVLFLGADKNGVSVNFLMATDLTQPLALVRTDSQGGFSSPLSAQDSSAAGWQAEYAGSSTRRAAQTQLRR